MPTSNEQHQVAVEQVPDDVAEAGMNALFDMLPDDTLGSMLRDLRYEGWSVAVHNDYRLGGEAHTFWLLTHGNGRFVKGEGRTDQEALAQCRAQIPEAETNANLLAAIDAASTKQAEGHSEFCSAQVGPVEDCPVCADPVDVADELAELIHNCRIATAGVRLTQREREWIRRLCNHAERLSASTDRYGEAVEAGYQKGLEDAAAIARKYLLCSGIGDEILALSPDTARDSGGGRSFQDRVQPWMLECFGAEIAADELERSDRFIEEALELVQSQGYGSDRAHALVDYVFGRTDGEPFQEVGGVMVTLAALCLAAGLDMHEAGEAELARISAPETIAKIRAKQAAKPTGSALPIALPHHPPMSLDRKEGEL